MNTEENGVGAAILAAWLVGVLLGGVLGVAGFATLDVRITSGKEFYLSEAVYKCVVAHKLDTGDGK